MTAPDAEHSRSGWCSTAQHTGCQRRAVVALLCGCTCHRKNETKGPTK